VENLNVSEINRVHVANMRADVKSFLVCFGVYCRAICDDLPQCLVVNHKGRRSQRCAPVLLVGIILFAAASLNANIADVGWLC